ncbi:uncharacterized protein BO97DRAFT_422102 [Aspergillus homomorphus CBS 101889]|uniref:Alcohol dehydrogenase-like N-terminal domain-containing protein n=1 Tax=Aspergillus homomorphus (strain CBS 101889) TaxID=1450537 RepID=A0A395I3T6_ASPHC|nr:hypothetical protein BO97DRAFT_422102 [Aspergillus homomorphus CBS 101889]RAL14750.1 hypothetical protein BO97DRAFT_422102 [Aspergillus homomorphus CBS 101889]
MAPRTQHTTWSRAWRGYAARKEEEHQFLRVGLTSEPANTPSEVEVRVHAVRLNFKDCLIALGPADTLGNECAGVVTRVGPACSPDKVRVEDRVCMSTVEAFKTYARSKVQCVCRLPEAMSSDG